jgi:hypothetical protein
MAIASHLLHLEWVAIARTVARLAIADIGMGHLAREYCQARRI